MSYHVINITIEITLQHNEEYTNGQKNTNYIQQQQTHKSKSNLSLQFKWAQYLAQQIEQIVISLTVLDFYSQENLHWLELIWHTKSYHLVDSE